MTEISVKGIKYLFEKDDIYEKAKSLAEEEAKNAYEEEAEEDRGECQTLIKNGNIKSENDYNAYINKSPLGVDHLKSFEENREHPEIQNKIARLTNEYLRNFYDLPEEAVVEIDSAYVNGKGEADADAVREALKEKFPKVIGFKGTGIAEKGDIYSSKSFDKIKEMMETKDFKTFLDLRASLRKYSANNISMIYAQEPNAKAVMGYQGWKKYGRQVNENAKSLWIWSPHTSKAKTEKQVDKYIEKAIERGFEHKTKEQYMKDIEKYGEAELFFGYELAWVFDISQTFAKNPENDNLEDILNLNKPLKENLENAEEILTAMEDAGTLFPFPTVLKNSEEALWEAVYDYADNVLSKCPEKVSGIKSFTPLTGDMHKIETVMSAHLICSHIGIDTGDKAGFSLSEVFHKELKENFTLGKRGMFTKGFDRACKLADQFTKEFDKHFEKEANKEKKTPEIDR